jgi:hypothetical protein
MRRLVVTLSAAAAIMVAGTLTSGAQITRGAASLPAASQNFTPIEQAACGPHRGRYCGPWHHRVCRNGYCWCAHC